MNSIQISIQAREKEQEILISELEELGAEGFEQTDELLVAYFSENRFPSYDVKKLLEIYDYQLSTLEERNWNEVWERNFQPVIVGDFCCIRAAFHPPSKEVQHDIVITPKMSFGTGHHATTYMMVEQMKEMNLNEKKVFDFGTGTGILSILAEKSGAFSIHAIDVDEWSISNAKENAEINHCSKINLQLTSQLPTVKFDVVLANINRNVILQYLDGLDSCVEKESAILLSGLLTSDEEIIVEACTQKKWKLIKMSERDNWISLLFIK